MNNLLFRREYFSCFGVLEKFIADNGTMFIGSKFMTFFREYGIIMGQSLNYYPKGNGLVESTNKTLIQVLKKIISENRCNWHKKLNNALWESGITPKESIGQSIYLLVYGKEFVLPVNIESKTFTSVCETKKDNKSSPLQSRLLQLMQLEEQREKQ